jgi:hypothetical protein
VETWQVLSVLTGMMGLGVTVVVNMLSNARNWGAVTATLSSLVKTVDDIKSILAKHEAEYWKKEDAMRELGKLDQKVDKAHSRVDDFHEICMNCKKGQV